MADQVNANNAMVGGEIWNDIVPPVNGGAETVDEDNGWTGSFDFHVCRNHASINDLTAVTRRGGPRLRKAQR
jgi:hypothetical protein